MGGISDLDGGTKDKTESITLRLRAKHLEELRRLSQKSNRSLNMQVARLVERYLSWWRYEEDLRFISLSPDGLRLIFASLGSEKAAEIGKNIGKIFVQEMILHIFGQINKGNVLRFLRVALIRFPSCDYRVDGNKHSISIVHDINEQFSIYICTIMVEMLESIGISGQTSNKHNSLHVSFEI